jgi:hypothetical protein
MQSSKGVTSSKVIKGRRFQSSLSISEAMTLTAIRTMLMICVDDLRHLERQLDRRVVNVGGSKFVKPTKRP